MEDQSHLYVQDGIPDSVPGPPLVRVGEDAGRGVERDEDRVGGAVVGLAPVQEVPAGLRDENLDLGGERGERGSFGLLG